MPKLDINNASASDYTNISDFDYTINPLHTDGATGQKEYEYVNTSFQKWWGYFNSVAELKSALLMKAIWTVGKGYTADPRTTVILDNIRGFGKDTFKSILFNLEVTKRISGDAYAEIIIDKETGELINLKPLDPSSIVIIVDEKGMLKRYEQRTKLGNMTRVKVFQPNEIFHLCHNRLADQIHGISDIKALEKILLAEAESFDDVKKIMHRQARPMILWKLKTDDQTTISNFIGKIEQARKYGEDMFIPDDEDAISHEIVEVNVSQIIMEWRNNIRNKYYQAVGLPQIVFGSAGATESGGKIEYLAHEQVFEHDQKEIEEQIWQQLQLRINLYPPATLQQELQQDNAKDGPNQQTGFQPSDTTAGVGR